MNRLLGIVFVSAVIASPGCTLSDYVELYNNTGTGVAIHACDRVERLGDGLTLNLWSWCKAPIVVTSEQGRWVYSGLVDREAIRQRGVRTRVGNHSLKAQLERDGAIILVTPDTRFPAVDRPIQPEGFPLLPDKATTR